MDDFLQTLLSDFFIDLFSFLYYNIIIEHIPRPVYRFVIYFFRNLHQKEELLWNGF